MSNRFWNPAGAANWGDANVFAETDGGDPTGIATPTASDDVFFTGTNVNNCTLAANAVALSITATGYTGTIAGSASKTIKLTLSGNIVTTGTLKISGNSAINRLLLCSSVMGTPRTLTLGGITTAYVDFRDMTAAGAANWDLTAQATNSSGDCGGNTGITFTTSDTMYFMKASGNDNWSTVGNWFLATDGGGGAGRVPLPQDDVVFDANSFDAAGQVLTQDMPRAGRNITWAGDGAGAVANDPVWTTSTAASIFGSLTLVGPTVMVLTASTQTYTFEGRGVYTLTNSGQTWAKTLLLNAPGGTLKSADELLNSSSLRTANGTWDFATNNNNVTCFDFKNSVSGTYGITLGSGTITLTGTGTVWDNSGGTYTLTPGTSTVKITDTSNTAITFDGDSKTFYNLWFSRGTSTATNTITGSNTFTELKDDVGASHSLLLTNGTIQTVTTLTLSGTAGKVLTINSDSAGVAAHIYKSSGIVSLDYLSLKDIHAENGATFYAGANSTNTSGNSGWIFTIPTHGRMFNVF